MLDEMLSYAASPSFDELLRQLASGAAQQGAPLDSIEHPLQTRTRKQFQRPLRLPGEAHAVATTPTNHQRIGSARVREDQPGRLLRGMPLREMPAVFEPVPWRDSESPSSVKSPVFHR